MESVEIASTLTALIRELAIEKLAAQMIKP
jgi:hypothetical protein